jgi:AraC-like DNA-binding protein
METARVRILRTQIGGSSWEIAQRRPRPALRPHVLRMLGYDERSPGPQLQRQFPVPFVPMILELGAPLRVTTAGRVARHPGGFVAGLGDAVSVTEHAGAQRGIQVDLTPTGARRLLGLPLVELADRVVALRDVQPREHTALAEQLADLPSWDARLDALEDLLLRRLARACVDTARVDWAVAQIERAGGTSDVGRLARELGCSRKHLIALFRDQVGIAPKRFARLVRFDRAMAAARSGRARTWAELALACGYYDQAHLVRDVRHFTGLPPSEARGHLSELDDLIG